MKKIIFIFLIVLYAGCGTRTKNISESEKQNTEKGFLKQNDSTLSAEKNIQEKSSEVINRVQEMNSTDESETNTKTTIDYDGTDGKPPLEINGPKGKLTISGTGKVNVVSETNSKQSVTEHNALVAERAQYKINEENYKNEIHSLTRLLENSQWETIKEKQKTVKVSRSVFWLWLAIVILCITNAAFIYLWIRK